VFPERYELSLFMLCRRKTRMDLEEVGWGDVD
jgi:hypothetical protein